MAAPIDTDAEGEAAVPDGYDFALAYRRVNILYCGQSPTYDELSGLSDDRAQAYQAVHDALDRCLTSAYWIDEGLPRLADERIRPVSAVVTGSSTGFNLGDYGWDYRLYAYVMSGDRDVRDLLLADYHVTTDDSGTLVPVTGTVPAPGNGAGGQPLAVERRAGMLTTQWFLSINTMFSPLPRTTAAQAYRFYLGYNVALQQGLYPVADEPRDVDRKGVAEKECASCHSTLDPLSYAFASYQGIAGAATGTYDPGRPSRTIQDWTDNQAMLFGEPVDSVRQWAEQAAASDAFKRELVATLFRHAIEREPHPGEAEEFAAIWRALPGDGWSANRVIHRIVDSRAFGVRP
ncbi:MAG: hypothetical protein AAGC55_16460 [Myxococcota bacterium]